MDRTSLVHDLSTNRLGQIPPEMANGTNDQLDAVPGAGIEPA
jgi:hypothetical protein